MSTGYSVSLEEQPLGMHTGQYILKKSLNDFFTLSNHLQYKFGKEAPKLDKGIFINRIRGDRIKVMNKSIKFIESYMRRLGRLSNLWDD